MSSEPRPIPADPSRKPTLPESETDAWKGMIWALVFFLFVGALLAMVKYLGHHP